MPWQCSFKKLCFFAPIMPNIMLAQSTKANPFVHLRRVRPMKGNSDSGIQEILAFNMESGIRENFTLWNPESQKGLESRTQVPMIRDWNHYLECRIQDWIPLHGATESV